MELYDFTKSVVLHDLFAASSFQCTKRDLITEIFPYREKARAYTILLCPSSES